MPIGIHTLEDGPYIGIPLYAPDIVFFWTFGYSDKIFGIGARRRGKLKILDTVCNKPHLTKKLTVPQTLQPLDLAFCSDVVHKSSNPIVIHLAQRRI